MSPLPLLSPSKAAENAKLLKDIDELFLEAKKDRESLEPQWLLDMAFYLGKQWHDWDKVRKQLLDLKEEMPWWRITAVINLVLPAVLIMYAKILQQRPTANAQPANSTPEGIRSARMNDKLLEYGWKEWGKEAASKLVVLYSLIFCTGLWKLYWDKDAGDMLYEPPSIFDGVTGDEIPNPNAGKPKMVKRGVGDKKVNVPLHLGDLTTIPVSPFEFYPEPNVEHIKDMEWAFHVKVRTPGYVLNKYGVEMETEEIGVDHTLVGRLSSLFTLEGIGSRRGVVVKEFWRRPTVQHHDGQFVVYAGDRVLHVGPNPYPETPLPFFAVHHIPVPGRFWAKGAIEDLIDIQRNYNKTRSDGLENLRTMARPKWLIPAGSLPPDKEITTAPGENIEYEPIGGLKPEPIAGKEMPQSYWTDLNQSRQEVYEVGGQHEVSRAQVPGGTKTGVAIAYLIEQDDTRLSPTIKSYEESIEALETASLRMCRRFYQEPRTLTIVGSDEQVEVLEFHAKEFIPEAARVKVNAGSAMPRSRVARQQFLLDLWDKHIITDPRVLLRLLEVGDVEGLYDEINLDIRHAERENERMRGDPERDAAPQQVAVEDFHNHEIHIPEHNKVRKSVEFEQYPEQVQMLFARHVADHTVFMPLPTEGAGTLSGAIENANQGAAGREVTPESVGAPSAEEIAGAVLG